MHSSLSMWALRFNTTDYPDQYVARKFENDLPTDTVIVSKNLLTVRHRMEAMGLVSTKPMPGDEENLVEVWL